MRFTPALTVVGVDTCSMAHCDHVIGCFSKNSHIKSLAEMFRADLPRVSVGDFIPSEGEQRCQVPLLRS